ncbi:MAG: serine--tRNA ligase [Parcubacteria group bacterium]|nr:serine--tRNA ligase [Parcubacteria group bacterium]
MLDINLIRKDAKKIKTVLKERNKKVDVDLLLKLDKEKRELLQKVEDLRAQQNKANSEISRAKDGIKKALIPEMKAISEKIKEHEPELEKISAQVNDLLSKIPNIHLGDVPIGKDENENQVVKTVGELPKFDFKPKDHMALGEALDIIDMKKAAKISGARFAYLKGAAAMLEIALINLVISTLTSEEKLREIADSVKKDYNAKPFIPVFPPVMINPDIFARMGRLTEEDKDDKYHIESDDKYLIGSAEHTLGPLHMDETLAEKDLPIRYIGFSTNFRREAGTYGKDTKGILRVHQFDKLEMESFTLADHSQLEQDFIIAIQEYLLGQLKLPYQVVNICTGDMGDPDARQIDMEVWLPGQNKYRETHTSDLMTDYQARRLNIKAKRDNGQKELVHMNDATAFAVGRTIIAILENYQQKDGSVKVPEILQKYMGGTKVIK